MAADHHAVVLVTVTLTLSHDGDLVRDGIAEIREHADGSFTLIPHAVGRAPLGPPERITDVSHITITPRR